MTRNGSESGFDLPLYPQHFLTIFLVSEFPALATHFLDIALQPPSHGPAGLVTVLLAKVNFARVNVSIRALTACPVSFPRFECHVCPWLGDKHTRTYTHTHSSPSRGSNARKRLFRRIQITI
ncbi:unnamed protein product [Protopolystoma xenopodis]|uniref:Uncharacterized protein n=1 Tax=Protopolystoma xenopodis TaxID=117903 RepID=A0A3S5B390_9PLAT|nr:unnamed protein product [Protopolystoma xenopodis]